MERDRQTIIGQQFCGERESNEGWYGMVWYGMVWSIDSVP